MHEISFVNEKGYIESLLVVSNPFSLRIEVAAQVPVAPFSGQLKPGIAVELRVGQDRYREGLSCLGRIPRNLLDLRCRFFGT